MSYVQLAEGGFQVAYPLGLWSRFSGGLSPIQMWLVNYFHLHLHTHEVPQQHQPSFAWSTPLLPAFIADRASLWARLQHLPMSLQ